ncbi:uncharacterized protein LOC135472900 [Liolophura sinensis]|uniref:uncharacterized protein LOC135472900 n=1 Tax=Liolophura sinensis TaxID=3198878 RepID=UPI0031582DB6
MHACTMMESIFVAVLWIVGVVPTVSQLPANANDYFLLKLHGELVVMNFHFRQMERKFNDSKAKVDFLEAEVRRLKMGNGGNPKMAGGVCALCKTQLENLEAGLLVEKWRSSQADEALENFKDRLGTLVQAVESTEDLLQAVTQLEEMVEFTQYIAENCTERIKEIEHREQTRWYVRGGRVNTDDTVSRADCSPGTVVECTCSHESETCDGVEVDGRSCYAAKSGYRPGPSEIWARAVCEEDERYQVVSSPVDGYNGNPLAKCPPGTQVTRCWLRNRWMHEKYIRTIKDVSNNTCKPEPGCEVRKRCRIQALCKMN